MMGKTKLRFCLARLRCSMIEGVVRGTEKCCERAGGAFREKQREEGAESRGIQASLYSFVSCLQSLRAQRRVQRLHGRMNRRRPGCGLLPLVCRLIPLVLLFGGPQPAAHRSQPTDHSRPSLAARAILCQPLARGALAGRPFFEKTIRYLFFQSHACPGPIAQRETTKMFRVHHGQGLIRLISSPFVRELVRSRQAAGWCKGLDG